MIFKAVLVGTLLGGSLLTLSYGLGKMTIGFVLVFVELAASLIFPAAAFVLYPAGFFLLMYLSSAQTNASGGGFSVTAIMGPLAGKRFSLSGKTKVLVFGRENCDVNLPRDTAGVSRQHCTLTLSNGEAYLTDNSSNYGTYLMPSRQRLIPGQPVRLEHGQAFCLAREDIMFIIERK